MLQSYNDKEIEDFLDTFHSEGFKRIEEDFGFAIEALRNEMEYSEDSNKLHYLRGQIAGYRRLLGYRSLIEGMLE